MDSLLPASASEGPSITDSKFDNLQFAVYVFHIFLAFSCWYLESEGGWIPFVHIQVHEPLWPTLPAIKTS